MGCEHLPPEVDRLCLPCNERALQARVTMLENNARVDELALTSLLGEIAGALGADIWNKPYPGNQVIEAARDLRADLANVIGEFQRLQPGGSPPPGGPTVLAKWIRIETAKRIAELEAQNRHDDEADTECRRLLMEENDDIRRVLRAYVDDENRYNRGEGEPYGSITTEIGMSARVLTR